MRPITAVLFDADGVVQQPPPAWREAVGTLCGDPDRADEFLTGVFAAERPCLDGSADFRSALGRVLAEWRSPVDVDEALSLWTRIDPHPGILSIVAAVRRAGISVALASNQQSHRAAFMTSALGYAARFDHLLYSCELGCAKPSAEYFRAALERLRAQPGDVLFLDDHEQNVTAARACGLRAERFHVSEGATQLERVLRRNGVSIAADGAGT